MSMASLQFADREDHGPLHCPPCSAWESWQNTGKAGTGRMISELPGFTVLWQQGEQQLQPHQQQKIFLYGAGIRYRPLLRAICLCFQFISPLLFHNIYCLLISAGTIVLWMCSMAFKPPRPPANFIIVLSFWVSQMPGEEPLDTALKIPFSVQVPPHARRAHLFQCRIF